MFNDVNKVILMGNVTSEPDLRFTPSGTAVMSFGLATNRNYKVGEEWKDEVSFHNLVIWRNAETLSKRIKKGTRIYVEGRVHTRSWDGQDGTKKYKTEVICEVVELISRYTGENQSSTKVYEDPELANAVDSKSKEIEEVDPNDLPF